MSKIYADPNLFNERSSSKDNDRILVANADTGETEFLEIGKAPFYRSIGHSAFTRATITISSNNVTIGDGYIYVDYKDGVRRSLNHLQTTYTLNSGESLVYSRETNSLIIRGNNNSSIAADEVPLFVYDGIRGFTSGLLMTQFVQGMSASVSHCRTRTSMRIVGSTVTLGSGDIYATWRDGVSKTFTHLSASYNLAGNKALVYNKQSNSLIVKTHAEINNDDAVLFLQDGVAGIVSGHLFEQYLSEQNPATNSVSRASISINGGNITLGDGLIFTLYVNGVLKTVTHSKQTYTLVSGGRLVHNYKTNTIITRSASELFPGDAVLFYYEAVNGVNSGLLFHQFLNNKINSTSTLPVYVENELVRVVGEVKDRRIEIGDPLVIGFITDVHMGSTPERVRAAYYFNKLSDFGVVDLFVDGGDSGLDVSSTSSEIAAKSMLDQFVLPFSQKKELSAMLYGNHDDNYIDGLSYFMSVNEFYHRTNRQLFRPHQERWKRPFPEASYFFVDFEDAKIRAIFLNTTDGENNNARGAVAAMRNNQLNWLGNDALDFMSKGSDRGNWGVMIFSHMTLRPDIGRWNSFPTVGENFNHAINTFKAFMSGSSYAVNEGSGFFDVAIDFDFTTQGPMEIIASISGHAHFDNHYKPDGEWLNVVTDSAWSSAPEGEIGSQLGNPIRNNRIANTADEMLFDVFVVDRSAKKLLTVRYGAGNNRVMDY